MRTASLLLASLALFASCGGSADPAELTKSGEKALGTNDFAGALTSFQGALDAIGDDTSNAMYARAKLGSFEALAPTDATRATKDLMAFQKAMPSKVDARVVTRIANRMADAGKFKEAATLLAEATAAMPEADFASTIEVIGDRANAAGDDSANDALAGLGYVGD